jgi:hypothetical protein
MLSEAPLARLTLRNEERTMTPHKKLAGRLGLILGTI